MIFGIREYPREARLPSFPFFINRGNPLASGLVSLVACAGAQAADLARGRAVTTPGTRIDQSWGVSIRDFNLAASTDTSLDFTSGPYSLAAWIYLTGGIGSGTNPQFFARVIYTNEASNAGWSLNGANDGGGHRFVFSSWRNNGSGDYNLNGTTTPIAGLWLIVGTSDGTTRRLYVNGRQEAATTNNANPIAVSSGLRNSTDTTQAPLLLGAAWSRELMPSEVLNLYNANSRWDLILAPVKKSFSAEAMAVVVPSCDSWHPAIEQPYIEPLGIGSY